MSGFQFVHIETYSRKADAKGRSVGFVLDEVERRPEASTHVPDPQPPTVVYGCSVAELRALHDDRAEAARCTTKAGRVRRVRQDQHTLLTVVASHPSAPGEDPEAVAAWEARTVEWLRAEWGDALRCVVRHEDEGHYHVHAYVLPEDSELRARVLHPGAAAKAAAKAEAIGLDPKAANKLGDAAYVAAMRRLQDRYFHQVGIESGLARLGPGRRRLDRGAWRAEQAQAGAIATSITVAKALRTEAIDAAGTAVRRQHLAEGKAQALAAEGAVFVAKAKAAAAVALAQADAARAEATAVRREAAIVLRDAKAQARITVQAAGMQAERLRTWGARLGGLWGGLAGVQRRLEARADDQVAAAQVDAAARVERAKGEIRAELVGKLAGELATLRYGVAEGAGAVAALKGARVDLNRTQRLLDLERAQHAETSREREVFRTRWAAADNALQARGPGRRR